ncbi:MAG: helix-turn-helix transcriptional regulator [Bacteroidota bacterium]
MKFEYRARLCSTFGSRLKKLRVAKGLTPTQFSEQCGIDSSNLGKYESGEREPGLAIIVIMAKSLGITHYELMDFEFDLPDSGLTSS